MKKLVKGKESQDKIKEGIQTMYDFVGATYSPKGRNIAIGRMWGAPLVMHDGVSVAKEVGHEDPHVQMAIDLIKNAAETQVLDSADGTTVTTILAYNIIMEAFELMDKGANPMVLRKQINATLPKISEEIKKYSKEIKTEEDKLHIATVSSRDPELGRVVVEAFSKVGEDGLIMTEEGKKDETYLDYVEGMQITKGYVNPYFVTDPARMEAVVEDAVVVVMAKKLSLSKEISNLLEAIIQLTKNKNIVIFGDVTGDALQACIQNKLRGNINCLVVDPPGYGDYRQEVLTDIAIQCNATVIMDLLNQKITTAHLGEAKKVVANRNTAVIIGGTGNAKALEERITTLRTLRDNAESNFDKERYEERLAKLTTGVAVIRVGTKTEIANKEIVERIKDAVGAVRAARIEGVVPGGAITLAHVAEVITGDDDGSSIVKKALVSPLIKLLLNAGYDDDKMLKKIVGSKDKNFGYNADTDTFEDLVKAGVIDPAKVIRTAVENAFNVAGTIMTMNGMIAEIPDKQPNE